MSRFVSPLALLLVALFGGLATPSRSTVCSIDAVPAATLLVPYFEVDVGDCPAPDKTTQLWLTNVWATPALAQVTIWSDLGVPVLGFHIYPQGYGSQKLDLERTLCAGYLPPTGSAINNLGPASIFGTFPGCNNTTTPGDAPVYVGDGTIPLAGVVDLQARLTGQSAPSTADCAGYDHRDGIARGYITMDNVTTCNLNFPSEADYYTNGFLSLNNQLVGDYEVRQNNVVHSYRMVGLEADASLTGLSGGPTFYGRYNSSIAGFEYSDGREPLPTTFSAPYRVGRDGVADTFVTVWREADASAGFFDCNSLPAWYPLGATGVPVVAFDRTSNPVPAKGPTRTLLGLATQRVPVSGLEPVFSAGWLRILLQNSAAPTSSKSAGQAWVLVDGRISATDAPFSSSAHPIDGYCPATTIYSALPATTTNPEEQP